MFVSAGLAIADDDDDDDESVDDDDDASGGGPGGPDGGPAPCGPLGGCSDDRSPVSAASASLLARSFIIDFAVVSVSVSAASFNASDNAETVDVKASGSDSCSDCNSCMNFAGLDIDVVSLANVVLEALLVDEAHVVVEVTAREADVLLTCMSDPSARPLAIRRGDTLSNVPLPAGNPSLKQTRRLDGRPAR